MEELGEEFVMGLWREQFEALPPKLKLAVPSSLQFPKLDLKELPKELKYLFLGDDKTFPVIISCMSNAMIDKLASFYTC